MRIPHMPLASEFGCSRATTEVAAAAAAAMTTDHDGEEESSSRCSHFSPSPLHTIDNYIRLLEDSVSPLACFLSLLSTHLVL